MIFRCQLLSDISGTAGRGPLSDAHSGLRFSDAPGSPDPDPQATRCCGFQQRLWELRSRLLRALGTCGFLPAALCAEAASGWEARPQRLGSGAARRTQREKLLAVSRREPGRSTRFKSGPAGQLYARESFERTEEKPEKRLQSGWKSHSARARARAGDAAGCMDTLEALRAEPEFLHPPPPASLQPSGFGDSEAANPRVPGPGAPHVHSP